MEFFQEFTPIIITIGVGLAAFLTAALSKLINAQKDSLITKSNNELLKSTVSNVSDLVLLTVKGMNQTVVNDLKAASEDGKLTIEDMTRIKDNAIDSILSILSEDAVDTLKLVFGDATNYIASMIEATLDDIKEGRKQ